MAKAKNAPRRTTRPYVDRLLHDEYVQEQLRNAAARLGSAYQRTARQGAYATEDKKLYEHLRGAATSIRNATAALRGSQEPPPRHYGRNVVIVALGIGVTVAMAKAAQKQRDALRGNIAVSSDRVDASSDAVDASVVNASGDYQPAHGTTVSAS